MSISIVEAITKSERKQFFVFPMTLYRGSPYFVPPIIADELELFDPKKNPSFDEAEARLFMAVRNGEVVGRVAAILSHAANRKFNAKDLRFCHFDCIDDFEVAKALFDAVEGWGRELGMETVSGPHGFTSFDKEALLVEGFNELPTFITYYNYPYYPALVEQYGFEKHFDFVEYCVDDASDLQFPDRLKALVERVRERTGFRVIECQTRRELKKYVDEVFKLFDATNEELTDVIPLSTKNKAYLLKKFFPILNPHLVRLVANASGEIIGFMIAIPSLSKAFQKAKGRLFPFGWFHILWAVGHFNAIDMVLAGVKKECRGKGADLLMVFDMFNNARKLGVTRAESNPELELNSRIQAEWKPFNPRQHKRRRVYKKKIGNADL